MQGLLGQGIVPFPGCLWPCDLYLLLGRYRTAPLGVALPTLEVTGVAHCQVQADGVGCSPCALPLCYRLVYAFRGVVTPVALTHTAAALLFRPLASAALPGPFSLGQLSASLVDLVTVPPLPPILGGVQLLLCLTAQGMVTTCGGAQLHVQCRTVLGCLHHYNLL